MRIVLVCRGYVTQRPGGMLHVVEDRAVDLALQGHDVHVLTTGYQKLEHVKNFVVQGVHVHHLDCAPLTYTDRFGSACREMVRYLAPDVVHLDSHDINCRWWDNLEAAPRVAITMHGFGPGWVQTDWNRRLAGLPPAYEKEWTRERLVMEANALRCASVVLATSQHEAWMLRDIYGLDRVELVYNPIHPCFFEAGPCDDEGYFLCVGSGGNDGNRRFDLARQAAKLAGVDLRVAEGMPRQVMPRTYRGARAFVMPTLWAKGYDLTVAEATACRTPSILTATGSYLSEGLGKPWIQLVPRENVELLAEAMRSPPSRPLGDEATVHKPRYHVARWLEAVA